ncbi:MAG: type II toxin-antitoxin system VapC family toxin [Gemmatales bacterium]
MMILDSDHLTVLKYRGSQRFQRLTRRFETVAVEDICTTIINYEEAMRGWLAVLAKEKQVSRQVAAYGELVEFVTFFSRFKLVDFDEKSAERFDELRSEGVKIGTMDLKIASVTLVHEATLLTANRRDFEKVPGLRFENWLN